MSLRLKILGAIALVLAFTVGGSFLVLIRYQRAQLLHNTTEATAHLANTIRATLEHAMLVKDMAAIRRIVRTVGSQPDIQGVFVLDRTGTVRATSDPGRAGRPLDDGPAGLPAPADQANAAGGTQVLQRDPFPVLRSISLIPNAPACGGCHPAAEPVLGALVVDRSLGPMEQQLRTSLAQMLGSAGLAFLLLTATTYAALRRVVITPLADLGRAARAIEAGQYDTPLASRRVDEVGELAQTLDHMRNRIVEHLHMVQRWGQELETRVAERTQELRTLNRVALVTNEALDLTTIFTRALDATLGALGVGAGAILLRTPAQADPLIVQQGFSPAETEALYRRACQEGVDLACAGSAPERAPAAGHANPRALACFPIYSQGRLVGVLCADNPGEAPLAPEKLRLLEAIAAQLGGTAERAILHRNLERSFLELRDSQAALVERERQIAALEALRAATVTLSHHINNAATGIAGCRDVLAVSLGDQADWNARYALDGIMDSVKRIAAVLRALRELTRVELTPFPGGVSAIDIDQAIQSALAALPPDGQDTNQDASRAGT